jgi:peptidyl-dipeptidase Dcp
VKRILILTIGGLITLSACNNPKETNMNPLLIEFDTPYGVPPFELIKSEHYMPAYIEAMAQQVKEIDAIVQNEEAPDFNNTIAALDYSGRLYKQVSSIFSNLRSANTNDELQAIAKELIPLTSAHRSNISMNEALFSRINTVYEQQESLNLNAEQTKLLEKKYKNFIRGGANLDEGGKANLRKIDEELSMLSLRFGDNLLEETNNFQLLIEDEGDLAGLTEAVIAGASETAEIAGLDGKWVFTLHKPSWIPFLQYSEKRDLREQLYKAMYNRANNNDEFDNKEIINGMLKRRTERAQLLGYDSHADYILEEHMAKEAENVYDLLMQLWEPALSIAKKEAEMMQEMIDKEGGDFKLASWDWWYYAEKIRKEKYELNEEEIRPYFSVEAVTKGVFSVVENLFGVTFEKIDDIPVYHEDAVAYKVIDKDGSYLGVQYFDYHPRPSKRGGAWSTSYRKQCYIDGKKVQNIGSIVCNFSKPTGDKPALISFDEALTLFHEMGHGIHGLFSDCNYPGISGSSVARDFVELPSQIMENWGAHPEVLKTYALHYETGEPIPDELIEKITASSKFNQGFATTEYLAASILDMDYHVRNEVTDIDVDAFEKASMDKLGLIEEIIPRYRTTYFNHIWSSGYSAGYYSYIWAEVLDKDAFEAFKETELFNKELAQSFRDNILSVGGTEDPMEMYLAFRGQKPDVSALLEGRGLN